MEKRLQPEVIPKDIKAKGSRPISNKNLEEKGRSNTLPEDDEEFYACQEAVIDGVSISQQEENSTAEVLQIKTVDKVDEMWKWFQAKKSQRN